jgi:Protein of unknown function (DUF3309)
MRTILLIILVLLLIGALPTWALQLGLGLLPRRRIAPVNNFGTGFDASVGEPGIDVLPAKTWAAIPRFFPVFLWRQPCRLHPSTPLGGE